MCNGAKKLNGPTKFGRFSNGKPVLKHYGFTRNRAWCYDSCYIFLGRPLYCFICVRMKTVKFSVHKHNLSSPPLTAYTEIILKMVLKDKECNVHMNFTHRCICFLLGRKFHRASLCNSFVMKVCPIQSEHFDVLWHFYVQMKLILKVSSVTVVLYLFING